MIAFPLKEKVESKVNSIKSPDVMPIENVFASIMQLLENKPSSTIEQLNKLAKLQATLVRNYDPLAR